MAQGKARRMQFSGEVRHVMQEFADCITGFPVSWALALGRLKDGVPDLVDVVVKRRLDGARGVISRSRDFIEFKEGAPGRGDPAAWLQAGR
jgi:hypothetical protein